MPRDNEQINNSDKINKVRNLSSKGVASGSKATTKGAKAAIKIISKIRYAFFIPIIAIVLAIIIIVSEVGGFIAALAGIHAVTYSFENVKPTTEAQQILAVFESFTTTGNDDEINKYSTIFQKIKHNGYSTALCGVWQVLIHDYWITNKSTIFPDLAGAEYANGEQNYNRNNTLESNVNEVPGNAITITDPVDAVYDYQCGQFYLKRIDNCYYRMMFKEQGYKKGKYIENQDEKAYDKDFRKSKSLTWHYQYINNAIKMSLNTFVDSKKKDVFISPYEYIKTYKKNYIKKHGEKEYKKLSKENILFDCRKQLVNKALKNLEGKKSLLEKCQVSSKKIKKKKYENTYLNSFIYSTENNKKEWDYLKSEHKFQKGIKKKILDAMEQFESSEFNTTSGVSSILALAEGEIGNKGSKYWNGTKAWKNGGDNWCAIFCAWLMEQVGIDPKEVEWSASCSGWTKNYSGNKLWRNKSSYTPSPGDFIFYTGHVGIVYSVNGDDLVTIEGNSGSSDSSVYYQGSRVTKHDNYHLSQGDIRGYIAMSTIYAAHSLTNTTSASTGHKTADKVWNHFIQNGYSPYATAGIIGNMMRECGGDTLNLNGTTLSSGGTYYGLIQWNVNNTPKVKGMSIDEQLNFLTNSYLIEEFKVFGSNYKKGFTLEKFKKLNNEKEAAAAFCKIVERCIYEYKNGPTALYNKRLNNATAALKNYQNGHR